MNHVVTNKGGGGTQKDHVMGTWGVGVWFWSKFVHVVYLQPLREKEREEFLWDKLNIYQYTWKFRELHRRK